MLKSVFSKVADQLKVRKFIKKRLQHRCFPVNISKFLGTTILKNICEQLAFLTRPIITVYHSDAWGRGISPPLFMFLTSEELSNFKIS